MRLSTVLKFAFAVAGCFTQPVLSQASEMPACAAQCLASSLQELPVCDPTDIECICTNPKLNAAIEACVGASCTIKEALASVNITMTMCGAPVRDNTHVLPLVSGISGLFALVAVIVRVLAAGRNFALDDFFVVAAMAGAIPMDVLQLYTGPAGFGRDIWTVPFENLYYILKLVYITQVLYYPVSGFTKMAFLFFYLRIFPREGFRKILYGLIAITAGYIVAFDLAMAFSTWPTSYTWTAWDGEHQGRTISVHNLIYAGGAFNIALDIAILLVPIPELMRLSMSLKKKLAICCIFSVGTFTLVVSCIRVKELARFAKTTNATWDNVPSAYWSMLEINVGIFCACMPAFRRTVARIFPRIFRSSSGVKDPKYENFEATPDSEQSNGKKRVKRSFGASLLETDITKTVDTRVETIAKSHQEDEVHLVDIERMRDPPSTEGAESTK